jgi:RNA polymerase sigma-70 factor, ECF subfamily
MATPILRDAGFRSYPDPLRLRNARDRRELRDIPVTQPARQVGRSDGCPVGRISATESCYGIAMADLEAADLSDADLARLIRVPGSTAQRAEAQLYRRFAPRIELYGLRHLGSRRAAKDLVQEVLLRVIEALRVGRVDDPAKLGAFVLGTCRNVTWDERRADRRQQRIASERAALEPEVAAPLALDEREVVRLFGCMGSLPEREASVVRMTFWEERPAEDIGARLGVSTGNVRVLRHRALAKLVVCMTREHAP